MLKEDDGAAIGGIERLNFFITDWLPKEEALKLSD
jgi:hypothetical protein